MYALQLYRIVVVGDKEGVMLQLLQKRSAATHNNTAHSSVQHMINIPSPTKLALRSITGWPVWKEDKNSGIFRGF